MFAAIFFVSVGMLIDPALVARALAARSRCSRVVGDRRQGRRRRRSARSSPATARARRSQAGHEPGADRRVLVHHRRRSGSRSARRATFLYPVAVAVSAITTLTTPWLIRAVGPVASFVDRKLPQPLQTFAALYGSWLEQLRTSRARETVGARARRLARLLLARRGAARRRSSIGAAVSLRPRSRRARRAHRRSTPTLARSRVVVGGARAARRAVPASASLGIARRLGARARAGRAPGARGERRVDLAAAPRRALVVTLAARGRAPGRRCRSSRSRSRSSAASRRAIALRRARRAPRRVAFWRSAANLEGHVRAGRAGDRRGARRVEPRRTTAPDAHALDRVDALLPGLGAPRPGRARRGEPRGRPHARRARPARPDRRDRARDPPRRRRAHRPDGPGDAPRRRRPRARRHRRGRRRRAPSSSAPSS